MVAVLKKPKGQCTAPEKMLQFRVKIIVVTCCIVELGRLKKERKKKKEEKWGFDPCRFAALENLASPLRLLYIVTSLHKHRQADF